MRGATLVLTLTLSPFVGWTAGVWHASASAHGAVHLESVADMPLHGSHTSTATGSTRAVPVESDAPIRPEPDDATPAVATYTRDDEGVLYEEHSPQTEVARLRSPIG